MQYENVIIIKKKNNNINVNWLLDFIISLSYVYIIFFSNEKIFHEEKKREIYLLCG